MGLATATAIVAFAGLVGVAAMTFAQHSATDVRRGSLANTVALATARTDAFDGKSDESLTLINRGSGQPFEAQYQTVITEANAALESVTGRSSEDALRLAQSIIDGQTKEINEMKAILGTG